MPARDALCAGHHTRVARRAHGVWTAIAARSSVLILESFAGAASYGSRPVRRLEAELQLRLDAFGVKLKTGEWVELHKPTYGGLERL